jgi:hypothetical protein
MTNDKQRDGAAEKARLFAELRLKFHTPSRPLSFDELGRPRDQNRRPFELLLEAEGCLIEGLSA